MTDFKTLSLRTGWLVFLIAFIVYFFSAESTGSLWDCGEFILGAYKLQVVHPPGAPLFLLAGRIFTVFGDLLFTDPSYIAFSVNLMSGMFTAFAAAFVCWSTIVLTRLSVVGRDLAPTVNESLLVCASGLVAGLATAFTSSIWFSAVEGEVYAMSTFFTAMTFWAMMKWYGQPETDVKADRYIIFAFFSAGLSIGVHLLSLLTFPAIALFYYFKKYKNPTVIGAILASGIGLILVQVIQKIVIVGIPKIWSWFELLMVNSLGLPFHSGLFPTLILLAVLTYFGLRYAHKNKNGLAQRIIMAVTMLIIGFSTIGVVVIRANANPPINMNAPTDVMRLIPYLNREQYGERPLFKGPHFEAQAVDLERTPRYGQVDGKYEIVDYKVSYVYRDEDKMLLPRIGHTDRTELHRIWMDDEKGKPDQAYNMSFLIRYQLGWMYWRYFMWNFAGRQNGDQGFYPWDPKSGHWLSGIPFLDSFRLYNQSELPETMRKDPARNKYYLIPFLLGVLGLIFHVSRRKRDFAGLLMLFLFTGFGIIFYSNQPPNEPRERDYVLIGSFFTYCMWIGMSIPALFSFFKDRIKTDQKWLILGSFLVALSAPLLMAFQNFDDHSRRHHYAARDYASNFLESCDENAIIFTYGDNDTYPLWYAQEVEGIRPDVRVVNLSLIAVDWYINGLRRKINESPAIKLSISEDAYRGYKRNQLFFPREQLSDNEMPLPTALRIMGEDHPVSTGSQTLESYLPSTNLYIPIDPQRAINAGIVGQEDAGQIVDKIPIKIRRPYVTKDEIAVMDIIMSNYYDRPVYFSVTCREEKLLGLQDYMQLEGMGLKIIPIRTPSNRSFFIYGSGRVATDKVYDRVTNKWQWGNFDDRELYVNYSYGASVQAHKMIIWRSAEEMLAKGETQKAVELTDAYFEGFPHMNFPYTARTMPHINVYIEAKAYDKAQFHMDILAKEMADWMEFYNSIDPQIRSSAFDMDYRLTVNTIQELLRVSKQLEDTEYAQKMEELLGRYKVQPANG